MVTAAPPIAPLAQVDLDQDPRALLEALEKDTRLVPYGGGNFGMPLELQEQGSPGDLVVPTERFFMRSNGPVPVIDPQTWTLMITGHVEHPLSLSLADLQAMPQRTLTAFLECAGNGRTRFDPIPEGTPWRNDACGTAVWEGVSLADVLAQAGLRPGAVDLVAQGGDFPEMQRGLPLNVATHPDVMLVWEMNGQPLPAPNGGPVRLLVPTWSGIASTKWVVGIDVIDHPFAGHYNSESYVFIDEDDLVLGPVREVTPKSIIAAPAPDAALTAGSQQISGFAWSGYAGIATVEVSTDDGETWQEAEIVEEAGPTSWVRYVYAWDAPAGDAVLASRAVDQRGLTQPLTDDWNAKGYLMNQVQRVPVTVS